MVPIPRSAKRPLLPYEKQLIELLGCSVEEYEFFVEETQRRSGIRPAAYDHIPDIKNDATTIVILVNVAIGLLFTGVSYLLTPKPRMPQVNISNAGGGGGGGRRTLESRTGGDRFAQTTGFDSVADLAQYGDAIPIVWTKYSQSGPDGAPVGGVLVTPKLVWSRLFSLGTHQAVKLLFVVGETGVNPPDLAGVYIGNNAMDTLGDSSFAFWWNGSGRVSRNNLLYGTQYGPNTGDAHQNPDMFGSGLGPDSFSQALTPSNSLVFGVSSGMPNATQYRLNYKIVSVPRGLEKKGNLRRDRMKVCGFHELSPGDLLIRNGGYGFGYFRRQGIGGFGGKGSASVSVGTTLRYIISGNTVDRFLFGGADDEAGGGDLNDVNNTLNSECAASDDILQLGETIMINHSVWRVVGRSLPIWKPGQTQTITLQCIEVLDLNDVRYLGERDITTSSGNVNLHTNNDQNPPQFAGEVYDNLCRVSFASFRNTRPVRFTQIGLQSQVWGKFNGLCNFNSLLAGGQITGLDADNVQVQSGTMTEYFTRTSAFTLYYRAIGSTNWTKTGIIFCVRGSSPVSQFHQLTINHNGKSALEFRFVPITGARLFRLSDDYTLYWLIGRDNTQGSTISGGGISVFGYFSPITRRECSFLEQMVAAKGESYERVFSVSTGVAEISTYGTVIARSCDSGPEHRISYVNEIKEPYANIPPTFTDLTTTALAVRSNQNLSALNQLRVWISSGINNSNSFPQLVQYLLQNINELSSELIDSARFSEADDFCRQNNLFFDGAISERTNIRQYIADIAPFFLLNFVIANGKFALMPAVPYGDVPVTNLFTSGNIIEDSFALEYLPADQRRDFQAVMTYRTTLAKNELPVLHTVRARFADVSSNAPIESFDMSSFCTSRHHAEMVARYFLSLRRRVTHLIKFKTIAEQARVVPGGYIKVAIEQNVSSSAGNGVISAQTGVVSSVTPLADGSYSIVYYRSGDEDLQSGTLTIQNGVATDTALWGALFTTSSNSVNTSTYLVEQVEIDEEGLVNVVATEFPVESIRSDMSGSGILTENF